MNILIEDAMIVTMEEIDNIYEDKNQGIIKKGYILINNDEISEVCEGGFKGNKDGLTVIDGKGHCVIPGLVNTHTHAAMTLLRGYGEGMSLMKWLTENIWPMESKFKEEHIKSGTELACIEMLRTGTTTFNDMYFMQKEVFNVAQNFNIRAVLGIPILGDQWREQLVEATNINSFVKTNSMHKDLLKTMFAPHSPYTLSEEALKETAIMAKDEGVGIHIHISETEDEVNIIKEKYNMTSCELLYKTGIFNNKVVGAHCVHLTHEDMNIMKDNEATVVYNPQSNMKLASGVANVSEMLDMGINVALGTDGTSSNNNLNMIEEMETGAMLQKLWQKDPTKLNSKTMLKMATINGAKALGFNKLGMIKKGYKADVVMLDIRKAHMQPCYDIYSNIVFSANGSEIQTVIINGELIMHKGEFTKIDEERVIFNFNRSCDSLM